MKKALVVLSGGQDSTTCLYWTKKHFAEVHAITFDYGQRHRTELAAAVAIATSAGVASHETLDLTSFGRVAKSSLTDHARPVTADGGHRNLPSTFTPGRNLVFLTVAASHAISLGAETLVTGVCQTDYSGYPDCREDTIKALEIAIRLGNDLPGFAILTPLMHMTKADSVRLAMAMPGCLEALAASVTCYHGTRCGTCPACSLRAKGFQEAGVNDPAIRG